MITSNQLKAKQRWRALFSFASLQVFFALMIASFSMGGKTVFGILIGIPPVIAVATMSRKGILFIFYFMIVLFTVGQRTIYIGMVRFVPSEVLLWGLAAICLSFKGVSGLRSGKVPVAVIVLFCSTLFAVFATTRWIYFQDGKIDRAIGYAKMMWMAVPAFFVCGRLAQRFEVIDKSVNLISMGCLFLAFLGLSEYFHLGFVRYFTGFVLQDHEISGAEGFRRLGATFWGGPMLAGYLSVALPLILAHFFASKSKIDRLFIGTAVVLVFLSVYYSGHRGLWVAVVFSLSCYFFVKGLRGIFILLILGTLALQVTPKIAVERIKSLSGETEDSSAKKRKHRAEFAWEIIKKDPVIGSGWGASGLVHSDFLQLWADAGGVSLAALFFIFIQTWIRLLIKAHRARSKIHKEYYCGFIAALAAAFVALANQAWFNLPEQYVPFWVIVAMAYHFPTVIYNENKIVFHSVMQKIDAEKKQNG